MITVGGENQFESLQFDDGLRALANWAFVDLVREFSGPHPQSHTRTIKIRA